MRTPEQLKTHRDNMRKYYHAMTLEERRAYNKKKQRKTVKRQEKEFVFQPWQIAVAEKVFNR